MFELINGIKSAVETCMKVKPRERVLLIADNEAQCMWVGQVAMNVINSIGAEAVLTIVTPRESIGKEPPEIVASSMKNVDVILEVSGYPFVHTTARKEATAAGVRHFIIPPSSFDELKKGVSAQHVQTIMDRTENLVDRLNNARTARITNPSGTDLTMILSGRKGVGLHPLSGIASALPYYGEAAISPVEGTAEGIVAADLAIIQWKYVFKEPLRYTVKAGKLTEIPGNCKQADRLRKTITTDENASNLAELGIGTSHVTPWEIRGIRADAARLGTAHIGIGRNNDIGGNVWSSVHIDTLMSKVTIELDGECVLKEGKLLV